MVAFALRADGWYLRSDIIWAKPNPMPESVTDRPTKAHEYLFLLSKSPRYYYDADAIREGPTSATGTRASMSRDQIGSDRNDDYQIGAAGDWDGSHLGGRNKRSVWTVATQPFPGAHFATFPPKLIEPCVLAGSRPGDTVLDPFSGAGTTGVVALRHDRDYIGIELNPTYAQMARDRIYDDGPLLNEEHRRHRLRSPVKPTHRLRRPNVSRLQGHRSQGPEVLARLEDRQRPPLRCVVQGLRQPRRTFAPRGPQSRLKRYLPADEAREAQADIRNTTPLCFDCHEKVESARLELAPHELHPGFLRFVEQYDLAAALPRYLSERLAA
jgi:hypothetical protein